MDKFLVLTTFLLIIMIPHHARLDPIPSESKTSSAGPSLPQATVTPAEPSTITTTIQVTNSANVPTGAPTTARLLGASKPSAPYTIDDSTNQQHDDNQTKAVKNLVHRLLALNQTGASAAVPDTSGSALDHQRAGLELRSLMEMLNKNNYTSEVARFGEFVNAGPENITIANLRNLTQASQSESRIFLEELLGDELSKYAVGQESANVSSEILKDNHRFIGRHPARSKPSSVVLDSSMTVPPIRRTMDVVAENYTTRKIAEEANNFALKLVNQLNVERLGDENIIHSPFAIYQGLALLLSGAMGDTSRELDKVLLSVQSVYENTKLTHDQDRARLMASFGDVVRQLQASSTNHFQAANVNCLNSTSGASATELDCSVRDSATRNRPTFGAVSKVQYRGGTEEQHFIVANNLLFSPAAFEISNEFKQALNAYYNNTALTRMEIGSTESIQVINGWVRQATAGLIPAIMNKKSPIDEFNVMTLLSTSWLSQEWLIPFRLVASSLRSQIKLKGQQQSPLIVLNKHQRNARTTFFSGDQRDEPLMEFVDDHKHSHFVEYVRSEPSRHIHNYHTVMNKQWVDVVVVPFRDSNQRLITITPLSQSNFPSTSARTGADGSSIVQVTLGSHQAQSTTSLTQNQTNLNLAHSDGDPLSSLTEQQNLTLPVVSDPSPLTKILSAFATDPRRAMRSLWSTIAPDLITKQTLQNLQLARQRYGSSMRDEKITSKNLNIPPKTQLSMPLIRIDADSTISAPLNHIGLVNTFDPSQANFIGINGHPFNYNKLHLSNVMYKTTFNLNDDGINYDRTVKTLESMRLLQASKRQKNKFGPHELDLEQDELVNEVKLDTPFMFLVVDIKTKLVLYTGVVRNPAKEASG